MFNFIGFVVNAALYFKYGVANNISSILLFVFGLLFMIVVFAGFAKRPHAYGYFLSSFINRTYANWHYFLHISALFLGSVLIVLAPSWSPLIPFFLMILYNFKIKPYTFPK